MLSLESIKKSLGAKANDYSEEELLAIRRDCYQFAEFAYDFYYNHKQKMK